MKAYGTKPHIVLQYRLGPRAEVWICESGAQSSEWIYAMGETPRSAYNYWRMERDRTRKIREQYLNRGRVHTKGWQ